MQKSELTTAALDAAEHAVGDGPVIMVNLLWFCDTPDYPPGFDSPRPDSRSAYYEGYVGAFRAIARDAGITVQLVYAGTQLNGLVSGPDDDWDDIVVVLYERFSDLRKIVESEAYARTASVHRLAAIANWRFTATRGL